jgi:D-threonate/D-erythronate kinase
MAKIDRLVIADDLTGANDTGVHFIGPDHSVSVIVDPDTVDTVISSETVVLNTNTRFATAADAYKTVLHGVARFRSHNPGVILKKVDSTLRGNIGSEIDAVMKAGDFKVACVAPATPRNGRTVIDGICYIDGVPLNLTEIARDPFNPVSEADVRKIIEKQTSRTSGLLPIAVLRKGDEEITQYLESLLEEGVEIVVADAESIEDLRTIYRVFNQLSRPVLFVGSAGLFHATGMYSNGTAEDSVCPGRRIYGGTGSGKTLFVVGSLMDTTLRQTERLVRDRGITRLTLSVQDLTRDSGAEIERLVRGLHDGFSRENTLILQTEGTLEKLEHKGDAVGAAIGRIVAGLIRKRPIDSIVATGGDTAHNLLIALGVGVCDLVDEVAPGIPVATIVQAEAPGTTVFVTKAGSFGDENALTGVLDYLAEPQKTGADV